jgi:hypothetical protein
MSWRYDEGGAGCVVCYGSRVKEATGALHVNIHPHIHTYIHIHPGMRDAPKAATARARPSAPRIAGQRLGSRKAEGMGPR